MALPVGALVGAGASLLGGLFGGKKKSDPYAAQRERTARDMQITRSGFGNVASYGLGSLRQFGGQAQGAIGDYASYLSRNPYTDQRDSARLGQLTEGVDRAYQMGVANLQRNLNARGLNNSGLAASALSQLEGGRAGALSDAYRSLAMEKMQDEERRMAQRAQLLSGAAQQGIGNLMGGLGAQQGIDSSLMGYYTGQSDRVAQENAARAQGQGNLFASLGGLLGGLNWGGGSGSGGGSRLDAANVAAAYGLPDYKL